jgi:hypothetical protein
MTWLETMVEHVRVRLNGGERAVADEVVPNPRRRF